MVIATNWKCFWDILSVHLTDDRWPLPFPSDLIDTETSFGLDLESEFRNNKRK